MTAVVSVVRPRLAVRAAAPLLAIAYAIAVAVAANGSVRDAFGYTGASATAHAVDVAAGLGLLGAGFVVWLDGRARLLGVLATLVAAAWFAPDWETWNGGSPLVRSLGTALGPLFPVLLFPLVLVAGGRVTRFARVLLGSAYALVTVVVLGRALFRDPFLDPYCLRNCIDNVFLVHTERGIAQALDDVWRRAALVLGVAVSVAAAWRLLTATAPARRMRAPVLVPALVAGGAEAAYAVAVLRTPLEDPRSADFAAIFYVRSAALAALSVGLVWTVLRRRRLRAAVARLAVEIRDAPPAGRLREALALAVGDPTLDIAYGFSGSGLYIRGDGTRIEAPLRRAGRAVTPIVHHGRPIAVVDHDAALLDGSGFERELGSAARLAIENERLHAEVLAQLEDIRSSRARIVERGDAERRRLERDLHDGAQQRLLALSYDLRLARASAEAAGDVEAAALLASAVDEAQTALNELRELAHGIYPAILAEAGLAPALASLADEAPLPVEMRDLPVDRFGPAVETAAYLTVAEAIEDASRRSATFVSVEIARAAAVLTVAARDDGLPRGAPLVHLSDRIGALGGSLVFDATGVRAEIPCG